ncbi:MAG: tetratricopeptide repeat protein [Pirellulaceae bacterium]|nr:tetratricopeptide repeat protein [Pirellulaceae bacterium]
MSIGAVVSVLLAGAYLASSWLGQRPFDWDGRGADNGSQRGFLDHRSARDAAVQEEIAGVREKALAAAQRLVDQYPDSLDAICVSGMIHSRYGDRAQAVQCWRRCVGVDPGFADACHCLGEDALQRGEFVEAIDWFERALETETKAPAVQLSLGKALSRLGRMEEAIAAYGKHLEQAPESVEGCFQMAQAHMHLKQYAAAKKYHAAALQLDPHCKPAYFGLAMACDRLGQKQEAEKYRQEFALREDKDRMPAEGRRAKYDDADEMRKGLADSYHSAAVVYAAHGDLPQAEDHWKKALAVRPEHAESRLTLVAFYEHQERWDDAVSVLDQWTQIAPNQPLQYLKLGALHVKRQQLDAAEAAFRKAIELAPARHEGHVALAQLCLYPGRDPAQARTAAETAVRLDPSAAHYFLLCLACGRCGDLAQAETAIRRALELDPANPQYRQTDAALRAKSTNSNRNPR